jgi:NADPH2:quinone reductase
MNTKAIRFHSFGGPEVLCYETVELGEPGPGEVRIRHTAIGLNLIDTYHRSGLYPLELPSGLGSEAAGVVEELGPGVESLRVGDRVAYTGRPAIAYSQARNWPADRAVLIPEDISDEQAAAVLLKGLTAWYLLRRSYPVKSGDTVLLYAAAGGVGSLLSQWASHLGVTVIGIVSTEAKAELASRQGCAHVLLTAEKDIPARVRALDGGEGVADVYVSVGKDTFFASLDCLRPHGVMVSFGNASGAVEPFAPSELAKRGSLFLTRPILFDFINTPERLKTACSELFSAMSSGKVTVSVNQRYPLEDAAQAHRDIEARRTTGSTVLLPH